MEITQQSIEFGLLILGALLGAFKGTTYMMPVRALPLDY